MCVCVCHTSSVQLIVQEGEPSSDTMSQPAACGPVHCVDRQVAGQAALGHGDTDLAQFSTQASVISMSSFNPLLTIIQ